MRYNMRIKRDKRTYSGPPYIPIAQCAFCGDDAIVKAADNTPLCENCAPMYKPEAQKEEK